MLAAALQDVDLARNPVLQQLFQSHDHRRAIGIEHVEVEAKTGFEIGQLEDRFLEQFGVNIAAARDQHNADLLVRFVAHIVEDRQLLVSNCLRDLLDQLALLHLIRDLRDNQLPLPAAQAFNPRFAIFDLVCLGRMEHAAHAKATTPCFIGMRNRIAAVDDLAASGKIRPLKQLHQSRMLNMRIINQLQSGIDHFCDIVRRDVSRHANRNTARTVREQIGEQAGENLRLLLFTIIGRDEIDCAFVEASHQLQRGLGQARFGVAIGGGIIAVDIAEVPLPLDQRIAQRKILSQANHRVIDTGITMRVVFTDYVTHDTRGLLERGIGIKLQLPHRPQQAAVDGL